MQSNSHAFGLFLSSRAAGTYRHALSLFAAFACALSANAQSETASQKLERRLNAAAERAAKWAAEPVVVAAVAASNSALTAAVSGMDEKRWSELTSTSPEVVAFRTNAAGKFLRTLRSAELAEAFLNDTAGRKVALLEKTTSWSHAGKDKHDVPMTGKVWRGPIEQDASSGVRQIQIAVPVLQEGKPIGSLVVGLNIFELSSTGSP